MHHPPALTLVVQPSARIHEDRDYASQFSPEGQRNHARSRAEALALIERDRRRALARIYAECAAQRGRQGGAQ